MKNSKIPKIRFDGFTDDWEQREVSEIFKITRGDVLATTETSKKKTDEMQYPVYSSQTKDNGLMGYYNKFLFDNAITWTTDGANAGTVKYRAGEFYCTNVCGVLLSEVGYANKMVSEALNLVAWKYVSKVGNPKLMNNVMGEISIKIPTNIKEQLVISDFIDILDNLITCHQRKYDKLVNVKKSMLEKMFPKNGEKTPEIRFDGFTDDWEQREVSEIFKITRGDVLATTETSKKKTDEMQYPVYSSQTKDNGLMGYYNKFLFDNAITWTTDGANAGTVKYRAGEFYCTNVCGVLLSEVGYANKMVSEALNLVAWKYVSKVGNPKLMNNVMGEISIKIPTNIKEQLVISDFIDILDNLITCHQRELEKLKNIKKSMLEKMFV